MLDALLENRLLAAVVVVVAVPVVLIGYILLIEAILRRVPRRWRRACGPWLWLAPALPSSASSSSTRRSPRSSAASRTDAATTSSGSTTTPGSSARTTPLVALRNNVLWVIVLPLLVVGLGLLVAVLVDRVRYESTVKSVVFLPLAISFVAAAVIWRFMYELDPNIGTLNAIVTALGGSRSPGCSSNRGTTFFLIIVGVWLLTGFAMVILSAGLKGISTELLEAARVDGANEAQVFRRIVLPLLAPTIAVVATTVIIYALKTFDVVYTMTNGNFDTERHRQPDVPGAVRRRPARRRRRSPSSCSWRSCRSCTFNIQRFREQEAIR